ncbi:PTS fructose transporter subunit IIABC [Megasphaera vaginalis (ex Srinivasan et al. 2021)]|uniref:Phosphoenolpyruvate-dependent sugar PTS family porter, EIIA 2 component n=1 Tax=Megasphaera vaginalis (ex Srinivasan et al. 2021) TaxID=1111454 RepID=U7UJT6_9FIRM|nr:fructose PTS transporter subunit IIA [Megasphaera vaginalis (ex Srinivasan et al. 2021)]ERT58723.1 phosphoenolpyruvate-dependent sugar PTS family porter, EIIA 2 component [Megasphaera vaginalis (ex Srinivasan et al. 2021)]
MRIRDLLQLCSIDLQAVAADKRAAIAHAVSLMEKSGNLIDVQAYEDAVLRREAEGSTGIGEGVAIPHAKTAAVAEPGLAAMVVRGGVDYESLDDEPAFLFFLIAAPEDGADVHLDVLSRLSRMLMDDDFRARLLAAPTQEAFLTCIDAKETAILGEEEHFPEVADTATQPFIVAVTACPTGITHTYMAAEALENKAAAMGIVIKVETNGSGGVKNSLSAHDIERAAGVIVAADKNVPTQRFAGKRVLFVRVAAGIKEPERLIRTIVDGTAPVFDGGGSSDETAGDTGRESVGRQVYKHLMNGVSHMLPFVIGGGILIALAFLVDMEHAGTAAFGSGTATAAFLKQTGGLAFSMMLPILAGFIAGYLVLALKRLCRNMPKALEGTKPILIYPVGGLILIGVVMTYLINPPTAVFNQWLANALLSMTTSSKVILGLVLGGMMSIDFGGPINKAAYVFGTASLLNASGAAVSSGIMASVMIGGMVPPIAISLAMLLFRKKFTAKERQVTHWPMYALSLLAGAAVGAVIMGIIRDDAA